jgi:hypothetical protein
MTYGLGLLPYFQPNFHGALKTRVKIRSSRSGCWHFCWYWDNERFSKFRYSERNN